MLDGKFKYPSFVLGPELQTGILFFVLGNFFLALQSTVQISNLTLAGQTLIREVSNAKIQLQRLQVEITKCKLKSRIRCVLVNF